MNLNPKNIIVCNRASIVDTVKSLDCPHIIISISQCQNGLVNPKDITTDLLAKDGIRQYVFDDFDSPKPDSKTFNQQMARDMAQFIVDHKDVDCIVCQCDAGISRSSGVAAAISACFNLDDSKYFNSNGKYIPNRLVYKLLLTKLVLLLKSEGRNGDE